jgi:adenylate cyclase
LHIDLRVVGENLGLVIAEIELTKEDESFEKPSWASPEVTEDPRYYNSNLATSPRMWKDS